jgi:hypothetical protein
LIKKKISTEKIVKINSQIIKYKYLIDKGKYNCINGIKTSASDTIFTDERERF